MEPCVFEPVVEIDIEEIVEEIGGRPDEDVLRFLADLDRNIGNVEFSRKARDLFDRIVTDYEEETKI